MEAGAFVHHFPKLYHVTFATNLPGIQKHGLNSVYRLAELHSFTQEERQFTLTTRRRCIQHLHGISVRDQHAALEARMKSCLVKITIPEWLCLLNTKIFLFPSREKAQRLIESYQNYDSLLLEIDSAMLLAAHADHITLCRINAGAFLFNARPRGRDSFIPLAEYMFKNKRDNPAEITVDVPIPDVLKMSTVVSASAGNDHPRVTARTALSNK